MTKYSELSNFEINKLIADTEGYEYEIGVNFPSPKPENILDYQYINKKVTQNKKFWVHIDYCQFGNDAFTLMISNEISLERILNGNWLAKSQPISTKNNLFKIVSATNKNPCRAIAECYLLMRDECKNDIEL